MIGDELSGLDVRAEDCEPGELRRSTRRSAARRHPIGRDNARNAAQRIPRASRRRVAAPGGRAHPRRTRPRQRRAGRAQHGRRKARRRRGRRRARCGAGARVRPPAQAAPRSSRPRSDPQGRPTVVDLVPSEPRVVPVGRLDADTTGALLLTNDGELAHRLAHPRYGVPKVYEAEVEGSPDARRSRGAAGRDRARRRHDRPGRRSRPRASRRRSRVELTLHEGRKHQVKRMCEAVGHPVGGSTARRYAGLDLEGLQDGRVARSHAGRDRLAAWCGRSLAEADEAHPLVHRLERGL